MDDKREVLHSFVFFFELLCYFVEVKTSLKKLYRERHLSQKITMLILRVIVPYDILEIDDEIQAHLKL